VIKKNHTVIFVNGCFWHGHQDCKAFRIPKTRTEFWNQKIQRNKERDMEAIKQLQALGWDCIVVWECQLKPGKRRATLERLLDVLYDIFLDSRKK
jgi:DNA mismatch endonuclease (patch repair protein)